MVLLNSPPPRREDELLWKEAELVQDNVVVLEVNDELFRWERRRERVSFGWAEGGGRGEKVGEVGGGFGFGVERWEEVDLDWRRGVERGGGSEEGRVESKKSQLGRSEVERTRREG